MKPLIIYVTGLCLILITGTTFAFLDEIKRINKHTPSAVQSLASSMQGIDTHQFNEQHQPYLDYLSQK